MICGIIIDQCSYHILLDGYSSYDRTRIYMFTCHFDESVKVEYIQVILASTLNLYFIKINTFVLAWRDCFRLLLRLLTYLSDK